MRYLVFDIESIGRNGFTRGRVDVAEQDLTLLAAYDSGTGEYTSYTREELPAFWPLLEQADVIVGYNSNTFDIPLLNRYYPGDLSKVRSLDLMSEVYQTLGRRLRLQSLAEATLGKGKSGDGQKAQEWWLAGEIEKVREYCIQDVRVTKELFEYALAHGSLKYKDLREKREMKLDTSRWLAEGTEAPAITHALQL